MQCVICFETFTSKSLIYATPCGHIFHDVCIMDWLAESRTCPHCMANVTIASIVRLFIYMDDLPKLNRKAEEMDRSLKITEHRFHALTGKVELINKKLREVRRKVGQANRSLNAYERENQKLRKQNDELKTEIASSKNKILQYMQKYETIRKVNKALNKLESDLKMLINPEDALPSSSSSFKHSRRSRSTTGKAN